MTHLNQNSLSWIELATNCGELSSATQYLDLVIQRPESTRNQVITNDYRFTYLREVPVCPG
jgi:hypothetical protein